MDICQSTRFAVVLPLFRQVSFLSDPARSPHILAAKDQILSLPKWKVLSFFPLHHVIISKVDGFFTKWNKSEIISAKISNFVLKRFLWREYFDKIFLMYTDTIIFNSSKDKFRDLSHTNLNHLAWQVSHTGVLGGGTPCYGVSWLRRGQNKCTL